jgi:WD40 repeat protein
VAVTGGADHTVRIWDLASGQPYGPPLAAGKGPVDEIACGQLDGRPIAVIVSGERTVLRVWDLVTGQPLGSPFGRKSAHVLDVAYANIDGHPVAVTASADGRVRVWDLVTRRLLAGLTGHSGTVHRVACTELEGRPVAVTASRDGTVSGWWLDDRKPLSPPLAPSGHDRLGSVVCTRFEDHPVAFVGSAYWGDGRIRAWDLTTRERLDLPLFGPTSAHYLAVTHLGRRPLLVASGDEGSVRVWHLAQGRTGPRPMPGHPELVTAIASTRAGGRLVALTGGSGDGNLRAWDIRRGAPYRSPMTVPGPSVEDIACTELDGRPVAVTASDDGYGGYGALQEWDLNTGSHIGPPFGIQDSSGARNDHRHYPAVACTTLNRRPAAVTGDNRGLVQVWDLATRQPVGAPLRSKVDFIEGIACAMIDGRPVAVSVGAYPGREDSIAYVWDLENHRMLYRVNLNSDVSALACSELNGGPIVIFGFCDGSAWMWDMRARRRLRRCPGWHSDVVRAITCIDLDGRATAIIGSSSEPVRIWDLASGVCRDLHVPDSVMALTATSDGTLVIGSGCEVITYRYRPDVWQ